jgi:hypothetical protein
VTKTVEGRQDRSSSWRLVDSWHCVHQPATIGLLMVEIQWLRHLAAAGERVERRSSDHWNVLSASPSCSWQESCLRRATHQAAAGRRIAAPRACTHLSALSCSALSSGEQ